MDKLLKPERLDIDINSSNAAHQWTHWNRTFKNFLEAAKVEEDKDKLNLLINYVSPAIFEYINECVTYEDAINILKNIYVKPKNEIFARHSLSSRKQQDGESIDQYLQALKLMSQDCNFKAVSADQNRDNYIRDTFITGLTSSHIRQRLLEHCTLSLTQAFDTARALEMAQHHSESYLTPFCSNMNAAISHQTPDNSSSNVQIENDHAIAAVVSKCYFCGRSRHPRDKCPAKNSICYNCGKKGHFTQVCQSKNQKPHSTKITTAALLMGISGITSPVSLSKALIEMQINGFMVKALVDTGSSDSYISGTVVKEKQMKIFPTKLNVTMASSNFNSLVRGFCKADI